MLSANQTTAPHEMSLTIYGVLGNDEPVDRCSLSEHSMCHNLPWRILVCFCGVCNSGLAKAANVLAKLILRNGTTVPTECISRNNQGQCAIHEEKFAAVDRKRKPDSILSHWSEAERAAIASLRVMAAEFFKANPPS